LSFSVTRRECVKQQAERKLLSRARTQIVDYGGKRRWERRRDEQRQRSRPRHQGETSLEVDEESEAEVEEEEEESDDEFCDRTTAPVPKWEALAGNRAVWVQLCQQLRLDQGSLG
jgi:hypothetical protein